MMATYSADPDLLRALAYELLTGADALGMHRGAAGELLGTHGYAATEAEIGGALTEVEEWCSVWAASLGDRAAILEYGKPLTFGIPAITGPETGWALTGTGPLTFREWMETTLSRQIADLERRVTEMRQDTYNYYVGMALHHAMQELRGLRESWLHVLGRQLSALPAGSAAAASVRSELIGVAGDLGLNAGGFASAALAMVEGLSPGDAGLDELYSPPWYAEAHALARRLTVELEAAGARSLILQRDIETIRSRDAGNGLDGLLDEFEDLRRRISDLDERLANLAPRLQADPAIVADYLGGPLPVSSARQESLVGEFLAAQIARSVGDPERMLEIAALIGLHVTTPGASVALLNAMAPGTLQALPAASGIHPSRGTEIAALMRPFSEAMAMAGHGDSLEVDIAALMNQPGAAYWFSGGGSFDSTFLVESAVAAFTAGQPWHVWSFETFWIDGEETSLDPRVALLTELNERGPAAVTTLVGALAAAGALSAFLDPDVPYGDAGNGAASALALLGTAMDEPAARLILDVMLAIGVTDPSTVILRGVSLMAVPHLGSFAESPHQHTIPATPLRDVLDALDDGQRASVIGTFLARVMNEPAAARQIYAGFSAVMASTVAAAFDPDDPGTLGEAHWEMGKLADVLVSAHLGVELAEARATDAWNAVWQSAGSTAVGLLVAGGIVALGPGPVAGVVLEALATAGNIALPFVTDFGQATDNTEAVLALGYELEAGIVDQAMLGVAVLLHDAGLIELPAAWFAEGTLVPPSAAIFDSYLDDLEAGGFPVWQWFLPALSVGGATNRKGAPGE